MIISHKYKYIFIKPKKVAGTSVEVSLAKHLGKTDVWPPLTRYSESHDKDKYTISPQNYKGYYDHLSPLEIKEKTGKKIWSEYFKFTVVRNPWDLVVSSYFWEVNKRVSLTDYLSVLNFKALKDYARDPQKLFLTRPKSFRSFVENLPKAYINTDFYFYPNGKPVENFYIRFENLEKDFKRVCKKLKIPYVKLLSLKSKTRKTKNYAGFYDKRIREIVADIFKKEIKYFNYRF
ncbi:MAG: hypothetical protein UX13_C0001G0023 [Candidatus Woesebacteria bacterium GW2011_GWB1_45_5]|uniref:Sulfotransferase family protein n=1 Tax=Candidatus Woesebacteria bacterium GW2011_GWB1_45_5 TaxID=1618581 RepID=A0A0G1MS05_9BACT|nr:MAG: hypothetical protein UX13_C0001G0023 [Candidatus Woesebacteria bacterium GW2011_GWB1_45_5]